MATVPVRRSTLTAEVYERIKALVMDHVLAPDSRVNIDALARELGVSPTPVREALARLESEDLVRSRPLAGYTVAPLLTRNEFEELFELRRLLEVPAAGHAAARVGRGVPVDVAALRAAADLPAVPATDYAGYGAFTAQDARFHDLVAAASGNSTLRTAIGRLHAHLHLHRMQFPASHADTSGAEHHRIVDAIAAGDERAAAAAMREHLDRARDRHVRAFE